MVLECLRIILAEPTSDGKEHHTDDQDNGDDQASSQQTIQHHSLTLTDI